MGHIYKRSKIYWIKYYKNAKPIRESCKSHKETDAKRLMKKREGEISEGKIPGVYFEKVKFDDLADDFLTDYRLNQRKSLVRAERSIGQPRVIHHDFVFTYRGNHFAEGGIKRSFRTACINANVPYGRKTDNGITFHDIRRTVKTNMLRAGVNKTYRDLILGHNLRGMDAYYIKPDDDDLKQAMDVYTEWFDEQLEAAEHADTPIQDPRKKLFP